MKKIVLLVFVILSFDSFSQGFFEKGAEWHYTLKSFHWLAGNQLSTLSARYTKDSIINSVSCQEIVFNGGQVYMGAYYQNRVYLYEKDSGVYFCVDSLKRFSILYNYRIKKDSVCKIDYYEDHLKSESHIFVRVDSIGTRTILGQTLSSRFVTYSRDSTFRFPMYQSEIVEKIGDLTWMFNWWIQVTDGYGAVGLRCYEDSILGFHDFGIAPSCTYTNVSVEELDNSERVKIYPNPTSSILIVEIIHNSNYQIIEIGGRVIQENTLEKGENSIDVQDLKAGIYFLQVEYKGETNSFKFLKE